MQALPTQIKWVRDGLLIIGLDTEMQIYSQWSSLQKSSKKPLETIPAKPESPAKFKHTEKKQISSLVIPKNHSVMDLHMLNKAASAKNEAGKHRKTTNNLEDTGRDVRGAVKFGATAKSESTRFFDEAEILEIVQDSGLFMQAKWVYLRGVYSTNLTTFIPIQTRTACSTSISSQAAVGAHEFRENKPSQGHIIASHSMYNRFRAQK